MDTLRGRFLDDGASDPFDLELIDNQVDHEEPPAPIGQDERRMQVRAYNFWAGLLGDRNFPPASAFDPSQLPDFGPYSVLLDFTGGIEDPAIRHLGAELAAECDVDCAIERLSQVPSRSLLTRITDHYMQILANQAPIGFEAEFVSQRGATILYRGILLPFSSDNVQIDAIYGVINWKELADPRIADSLLREIGAVAQTRVEPARAPGPMAEWADAPVEERADGDETCETLSDCLALARESALLAKGDEDRTRHALYAAISRAYDFALAAAAAPDDFQDLLRDAGLIVQDRAPMTPVVKLVFGAQYDKTRLTEYASALSHAQRLGLPAGGLADYLAAAPGGLKGVVNAERDLRRKSGAASPARRGAAYEAMAGRLRALEHGPLARIPGEGSEFTLLIARRLDHGELAVLGEVDDAPLLERAARHLIA